MKAEMQGNAVPCIFFTKEIIMNIKTFCFDLDNTLCRTDKMDYEKAKPIEDRIKKVNQLYMKGNKIIINTARGAGIHNNKLKLNNIQYITKRQLEEWGLKYHELIIAIKPVADFYVDDKGFNSKDFFNYEKE